MDYILFYNTPHFLFNKFWRIYIAYVNLKNKIIRNSMYIIIPLM